MYFESNLYRYSAAYLDITGTEGKTTGLTAAALVGGAAAAAPVAVVTPVAVVASPPPPSPPPSPNPPPITTATPTATAVVASPTVVGTVTLDSYTKATFGVNETAAFKTGIAKIASVTVDKVTVTVADARRHLLAGVKVGLNTSRMQ